MHTCLIYTSCLYRQNVSIVGVEVSITNGLPSFHIVGLADSSIKESEHRVRSAIRNSNFKWPAKRITVSLSPAWVNKKGSSFDLPIALAILEASKQIKIPISLAAIGELGLDGSIKSCPSILALTAAFLREENFLLVTGEENRSELLSHFEGVYYFNNLQDLANQLEQIDTSSRNSNEKLRYVNGKEISNSDTMIIPVYLQEVAWRALMIAISGAHHLFMLGSPGCGKTSIAKAGKYLLPCLTGTNRLKKAMQFSLANNGEDPFQNADRPFRSPHFTSSVPSLLGYSRVYPMGELALSDQGILMLDEILSFPTHVLQAMSPVLEDRKITRLIDGNTVEIPTRTIVLASSNPCSCGRLFERDTTCTCSESEIRRFYKKMNLPFFDRIDMFVEMRRLDDSQLIETLNRNFNILDARAKVSTTRKKQIKRNRSLSKNKKLDDFFYLNGCVSIYVLEQTLNLSKNDYDSIQAIAKQLKLSIRSFQKTLRLARTIADLEGEEQVKKEHVLEAFTYQRRFSYDR